MIRYKGKWALVTGASSGIGREFALALAKSGANVIAVARREEKLRSLAQDMRADYGVLTEVIPLDLSDRDAPRILADAIRSRGLNVGILVNNAGLGTYGTFHETGLEKLDEMLSVNIHTLASLTRRLLPDMVAHQEGYIFNIASTAAFQPLPYLAAYAATKAFVLSFSEALWAEYRSAGIRVLAVCPGATDTEFFKGWDMNTALLGALDSSARVAATSLRAMEKGRSHVICGPFGNRLMARLTGLAPRTLVVKVAERILRRRPS